MDPSVESDSDNDHMQQQQTEDQEITTREQFQNSPSIVTSNDTESVGGLNLATKEQNQIIKGHYQAQPNRRRRVLPERKQRKSRQEKMREKRKLPLQPAKDKPQKRTQLHFQIYQTQSC